MEIKTFIKFSILCQILLMAGGAESSKCVCGKRKYKGKKDELVINGKEVPSMAKYPWMVSFHRKDRAAGVWGYCGGAIISKTFVLTAAHCIMSPSAPLSCLERINGTNCIMKPKDLKIGVLGKNKKKPAHLKSVKKIIVHPRYKRKTGKNDIALVKLKSPIKCGKYSMPICLAKKDFVKNGDEMHIAGWGRVSQTKMDAPKTLREGIVKKVDSKHCAKHGLSPKKLICSVGTHFSSCQGDSGTSVFKKKGKRFYSLGVTSTHSSIPKCSPSSPVTFTSVPAYLKFIKKHVKDLPKNKKSY